MLGAVQASFDIFSFLFQEELLVLYRLYSEKGDLLKVFLAKCIKAIV